MGLHDILTTWCFLLPSQPVAFFLPINELVNPQVHVWLFTLPRKEGGKAAIHQRVFMTCFAPDAVTNAARWTQSYASLSPSKPTSAFQCTGSKRGFCKAYVAHRDELYAPLQTINAKVVLNVSSITVSTKAQSKCKDQQYFSSLFWRCFWVFLSLLRCCCLSPWPQYISSSSFSATQLCHSFLLLSIPSALGWSFASPSFCSGLVQSSTSWGVEGGGFLYWKKKSPNVAPEDYIYILL